MKLSLDIKRKLHTNNGVSILFSLLLFLVVSMVSVTIIASASSTSKQLNSIKQSNQANIDLDSAVLLIKDNISDVIYYRDQRTKSSKFDKYGKDSSYATDALKKSLFYSEIDSLSRKLFNSKSSNSNSYEYICTIKSNNEAINNVRIEYKYSLNQNNNDSYVIFKLSVDDNSFNNISYIKFLINYSSQTIKKSNSNYKSEFTQYSAKYTYSGVYQYDPS